MTDLEFRDRKHEIIVDGGTITVNRQTFDLAAIERVRYWASGRRINGAYQGTTFAVAVTDGSRTANFLAESGHHDEHYAEYLALWNQTATILEGTVLPRIAGAMIAEIEGGGSATFGGLGGVAADRVGVRQRKPLAKPVPWASIVGTVHKVGLQHRLLVADPGGGAPKEKVVLDASAWNFPALNTLIHHHGGTA